jgi:hypothetical protein
VVLVENEHDMFAVVVWFPSVTVAVDEFFDL